MFSSLAFLATLLASLPSSHAQNSTTLELPLVAENITTVEIYSVPRLPANESRQGFVAPEQKRISYSNANGLAIVDGDIILTTVSDLEADTSNPGRIKRRGLSLKYDDLYRKWSNGTVYYKYETQKLKDEKQESFELATKYWSDRLPHINFVEAGPPSVLKTADGGPITIRGSYAAPAYCKTCSFSPVGKAGWYDSKGQWSYSSAANELVLGDCYSLEACAGVYSHEVGHTLGLWHEHMRPDRDENVIVNCENIKDGVDGSGQLVTADCGTYKTCRIGGCNFVKRDASEVDYTGPYDRKSIMHYQSTAFSKDGKLKTVQGRPPFLDPEPSNQPTLIDAQKVCDLYSEVCLSVCGDGKVGPGEKCDDGNNIDGDGCSADCQTDETAVPADSQCGNGIVEAGEDCDEGSSNGAPGSTCSADCKTVDPETPTAQCGNGIVEVGEECDAGSSNGTPGTTCNSECKAITPGPETPDTSSCGVQTCDPRSGFNACHESTSCVQVEGSADASRYLCACRTGFRASGDGRIGQARIPVELWPNQGGRVYVNPGMACNQLCDEWSLGVGGCAEVKAVDMCF